MTFCVDVQCNMCSFWIIIPLCPVTKLLVVCCHCRYYLLLLKMSSLNATEAGGPPKKLLKCFNSPVTERWWELTVVSGYMVCICIVHLFPSRVFSERSCSLYAIARPSVCRLSVICNPRAPYTQAVQIFGNISTAFGTLAIRWHPRKILRRSSQGNPSAGGVKHEG